MLVWLSFSFLLACNSSYSSPLPLTNTNDRQDVVLIIVDTLRYDQFHVADTPFLDAFQKKGTSSLHSWSPSTWTAPSIISLFTGKTVREHGWDFPMPKIMQHYNFSYPTFPSTNTTLAEVLQSEGYETHGFYSNPLLRREIGFDRGFHNWILTEDRKIHKKIQEHLPQISSQHPQFFYVHLMGPHQPLNPSLQKKKKYNVQKDALNEYGGLGLAKASEKLTLIDSYKKLYLGVIEDTDQILKHVVQTLEEKLDQPLIIITSDHGEMLGEHNLIGHKESMYEELLHVPYMVKNNTTTLPSLMSVTATADFICSNVDIDYDWSVKVDELHYLSAQREGSIAILDMVNKNKAKGIWNADFSFVENHAHIQETNHQYFNISKNVHEKAYAKDKSKWLKQEEIQILIQNKKEYTHNPQPQIAAEQAFFTDEILHGLRVLGYIE